VNYEYAATKAIADKAVAGDVTAWEKLMDSAHGKLTDKKEHIITQKAEQLTDDQLADIATTSSGGIVEAADDTEILR
jgi:hypothetical protein